MSDENAYRERINKVTRVAEIEDLQGPRDPPVALLSIKVWRSSVLFFFFLLTSIVISLDYPIYDVS